MAVRNIDMTGLTSKKFVTNLRRGSEYNATIQNLTGQSLTITVTNQDIQSASPTFDAPAAGALVIANGAVGKLGEGYDGWLLTLGAAGAGTINIAEAG